jgi:RHS repeat-associated protein
MVSVPGGTYSYDAQNRLVSATVNGLTTEFTYDSRNRVVRRTSPTGTLNLTYSGWNLIEERNGGGELEQTYVHGAGTDEMLVKVSSSGPAYYHHDGLGSTVALTGENGELLESYRYDAFGGVTVYDSSGFSLPVSGFQNRFLFTGREWLGQAGIYDYRNRVYSASLGRFLQADPIRFSAGDVNLYRYCGNGPVNWKDPLGLWQLTIGGGLGGFGGSLTFGNNGGSGLFNGQWNSGAHVGLGAGLYGSLDPFDSGCHINETVWGFDADGAVGMGEGIDVSIHLGNGTQENQDSAEIGVGMPGTPFAGSVMVGGGHLGVGHPRVNVLDGISIGFGATHYF